MPTEAQPGFLLPRHAIQQQRVPMYMLWDQQDNQFAMLCSVASPVGALSRRKCNPCMEKNVPCVLFLLLCNPHMERVRGKKTFLFLCNPHTLFFRCNPCTLFRFLGKKEDNKNSPTTAIATGGGEAYSPHRQFGCFQAWVKQWSRGMEGDLHGNYYSSPEDGGNR